MATQPEVSDLFMWLQRELKEGGRLHRYLLPPWVRRKAIPFSESAFAKDPSTRAKDALKNYACTVGQSEWIDFPFPTIESADVKGIQPDPAIMRVQIYFDLIIRIVGKIKCASGCTIPDVNIDVRVRLPLVYSMSTIMLVLPGNIKKMLWLNRILRGAKKIADLDPEIRALVEKAVDPLLKIVKESADLLCAAQLDLPALQKKLQGEIDWMAIPDENKA